MKTVQKNIPQLRFSDFSEKWNSLKYNDIFSFHTTNSFSRDKLNYQKGQVKNIHYGDIHTKFPVLFDIDKERVPFVNEDENISKIKQENYCKEGDLVIADASEDYNDIGKTIEIINLGNEKVIAGLHTFLARPIKKMVAKGFTAYLLQSWSVRKQVMTIAQGSKVLGLSYNRLGKINLLIPTIIEQQKIASFLKVVDTKISQLTRKKELLGQYKKGVTQKIFSQELRFKDNKGADFPKWKVMMLGDLFMSFKGKGIPKGELNDNGVNKCILYGELYTKYDEVIFDVKSRTNSKDGLKSKKGDLLIPSSTTTTGIDLANVTALNTEDVQLGGDIIVLRTSQKINNVFYAYYLSNHKKYQIASRAQGITIVHLYYKSIKDLKIDIPDIEEQTKIANFLSVIDTKINYVDIQLEKTKTFKKGLLQKMFV